MDADFKADMDLFIELAHAGAAQAGQALAQLVGHEVTTAEVQVLEGGGPIPLADPRATGVFFEFEGCLDAVIGILFPGDASEFLVRRIVGIDTGKLARPIVESALMEIGNILASHVASAIADRLDARLLPSIPSLAMSDAEGELDVFLERTVGLEAPRVESRLVDEDGSMIGRLVLVPRD